MADSTTNKSIPEFETRGAGRCIRISIRGFWPGVDYLSPLSCFGRACVRGINVS